tara:strand:+ start:399 stop:1238 length:840 start_codon:yes stop_codon:yes gene_type:complete
MIVWLASYPKSGNTLLRSILSSYFFSNDGEFKFENLYQIDQFPLLKHFRSIDIDINEDKAIFKNSINAQNFINKEKGKIKFFKTHSSFSKINNYNFTDFQNTLGVIYVVRDPRNVVNSLAHHYNLNVDEATETMIDKKKFMSRTDKNAEVFAGSWNFNYNSWKNLEQHKKYFLIKYEDLIKNKKSIILKVFKFLNSLGMKLDIDMIKLNKVIKTTEFEKMKTKEQKETFTEAMIDEKTGKRKIFFNLGPKNDWRLNLDKKNKEKIEKAFSKEMEELGYL